MDDRDSMEGQGCLGCQMTGPIWAIFSQSSTKTPVAQRQPPHLSVATLKRCGKWYPNRPLMLPLQGQKQTWPETSDYCTIMEKQSFSVPLLMIGDLVMMTIAPAQLN